MPRKITEEEFQQAAAGLSDSQAQQMLSELIRTGELETEAEAAERRRDKRPGGLQARLTEDFTRGFAGGATKAGQAIIRFGNRLVSTPTRVDPRTGRQVPMVPTNEEIYAQARRDVEREIPESPAGQVGGFVGEALPSIATAAVGAPEGLLPRMGTEALSGAIQGEVSEPGGAIPGALLGATGGLAGVARRFVPAFQRGAERQGLMVLSPGNAPKTIEKARRAVPNLLNEESPETGALVSSNPFRNTTRQILDRARALRNLRGAEMEEQYAKHAALGSRLDLNPVRASLSEAVTGTQLPGSQLPTGSTLTVRLSDIFDPQGNLDFDLTRRLGLTTRQVADLVRGSANKGVDEITVKVPTAVTPMAGEARARALRAQSRDITENEAGMRIAEATRSGQPLGSIPAGVPLEAARRMRQLLEPQYRNLVATESTAERKVVRKLAGDTIRHEVGTQYPEVAKASVAFSRMKNIEDLLDQKLERQTAGTASDRYAAIRGLASLIRTSSLGALSLPVAASTVNSSAYHAVNATTRALIARQIASGNFDAAARLVTRLGEMSLGAGESNERAR